MINLIILFAFQFQLMALAIDIMHRRGPSNEMHCRFQPNIVTLH